MYVPHRATKSTLPSVWPRFISRYESAQGGCCDGALSSGAMRSAADPALANANATAANANRRYCTNELPRAVRPGPRHFRTSLPVARTARVRRGDDGPRADRQGARPGVARGAHVHASLLDDACASARDAAQHAIEAMGAPPESDFGPSLDLTCGEPALP